MKAKLKQFLSTRRSPTVLWVKRALAKIPRKKIWLSVKKVFVGFINIFAENIYGIWLLRKWTSRAGYFVLFFVSLAAIIIADQFDYSRQFIHSANANEAVIGVFTILLALLIPLAIALIQADGNNPFARQTMVKTIVRLSALVTILALACAFLFIPSGVHIASESLTLKNLYAAVLVLCATFILAVFYRSIRWLGDEFSYGFVPSSDDRDLKSKANDRGFSSYRFAWIVRLLKAASPEVWTAMWTQRLPMGYEETIHEAFFKRVEDVIINRKRKQYWSVSLELQSYSANFDKRNKHSPKFEYKYPEKFFILFSQVEKILSDDYVDSRLDGLWSGKDALENISTSIIDALMDNQRVWSLFQAMNKYVVARNLVDLTGSAIEDDELVKVFLVKIFDAIKSDKVSAHDALSEVKVGSAWAVTYDNLYGDKRYNISFLVEKIYQKWLNDLLDQQKDKEYFIFVDTIVEHVFPGTDPITMGKLYWLLHLAHSSDYLDLWVKDFRPIGLVNFTGEFEYVGDRTKDDMWKEYRERASIQERNAIKLFCSRYFRYLRTDFMKLAENLDKARSMDRDNLDEAEVARLDDFIRLASLIEEFYEISDKEQRESKKPKSK